MDKRSKFHKTSLYCPDDKDIYDFLKATSATLEKMATFLRRRGIYLSENADEDNVRTFVSRLVLDWNDISSLIDSVDLRESKDKLAPAFLEDAPEMDVLIQAVRDVESIRQTKQKERYKIIPSPDGRYLTVEVDYLAVRNEKSRLIQNENESLTIVFEKSVNGYDVRHSNNDTAKAIYQTFLGTLSKLRSPPGAPLVTINSISISLKSIISAELRVKFFKTMTEEISEFQYHTMSDVKVDRLPKALRTPILRNEEDGEGENQGDDQGPINTAEEEEAERIRRVIITGRDLHRTKQLAEYFQQGFFISGMSWQSLHTETDEMIDFVAGFRNNKEAEDLEFNVRGKRSRVDGQFPETRENLAASTATHYCGLLHKAAFQSFKKIQTEAARGST